MKSSDNGYNSYVETLRPLCVVLVSAPHWFRLCQALITISSCSASLLARCLRLVATWRSSREVDSVHWTPYKMKPDCRIFTFLILSFTLFQDTQGKFLRNSNTFYKISFFYIRLLILNGEFDSNFFLAYTHFNKKLLVYICIFCLIESIRSSVCQKEKKKQIVFVWSVQWR